MVQNKTLVGQIREFNLSTILFVIPNISWYGSSKFMNLPLGVSKKKPEGAWRIPPVLYIRLCLLLLDEHHVGTLSFGTTVEITYGQHAI